MRYLFIIGILSLLFISSSCKKCGDCYFEYIPMNGNTDSTLQIFLDQEGFPQHFIGDTTDWGYEWNHIQWGTYINDQFPEHNELHFKGGGIPIDRGDYCGEDYKTFQTFIKAVDMNHDGVDDVTFYPVCADGGF